MPNDEGVRTKQLTWIRDGGAWLVGLAAGALVLSGTYYFDKFNSSPHLFWLLVTAWITLCVAILAGVLCYFSAWKDIRDPADQGALGQWVRNTYFIMMWSFVLGYIALTAVIITNSATSAKRVEGPITKLRVGAVSVAIEGDVDYAEVRVDGEDGPVAIIDRRTP